MIKHRVIAANQQKCFPAHPADRQSGVRRPAAVVVSMSGLVTSEVSNFDRAVGGHQTVPGSEFAVHVAASFEVIHRGRDL